MGNVFSRCRLSSPPSYREFNDCELSLGRSRFQEHSQRSCVSSLGAESELQTTPWMTSGSSIVTDPRAGKTGGDMEHKRQRAQPTARKISYF